LERNVDAPRRAVPQVSEEDRHRYRAVGRWKGKLVMEYTEPESPTDAYKRKRPTCPDNRCSSSATYMGKQFQAYACGECGAVFSKAALKRNTEPQLVHPVLKVDIG